MSLKTAQNVIQTQENNDTISTKGDIHATNYITESPNVHDIAWFKALTMQTEMSYLLFDADFNIIHWNNKYGTLNAAKPADLKDLHSITNYYKNKVDCINTLTNNIFHAHYSQLPD